MKIQVMLLTVLLFSFQLNAGDQWESLFDGKTLKGWEALPGGEWKVEDGVIVGFQEKKEPLHGMLISKKTYSDFEIKLKYKAVKGNSGFYFRAKRVNHKVSVKGFQAEIDSDGKDAGGLYETLGRAYVVRVSKEKVKSFYKHKEWNDMTVRAIGRNINVIVNGVQTAELKNDKGNIEGYFGLQLHGSQDMDVQFKEIYIKDLSRDGDVGRSYLTKNIHDKKQPLPPIKEAMPVTKKKMPDNAIALFNGSSLDAWNSKWSIVDGVMETAKGYASTKKEFGDCQLHIEWRVVDGNSAGNSGVFLQGLYEVQIFNSYNNKTKIYADGQAGAIYGQYPPAFNVCKKPGEWEVYDIDFTSAKFNEKGELASKAKMTVRHNGFIIHKDVELTGPTGHTKRPGYKKNVTKGPIKLQDHGDKIQFRNIWIVEK